MVSTALHHSLDRHHVSTVSPHRLRRHSLSPSRLQLVRITIWTALQHFIIVISPKSFIIVSTRYCQQHSSSSSLPTWSLQISIIPRHRHALAIRVSTSHHSSSSFVIVVVSMSHSSSSSPAWSPYHCLCGLGCHIIIVSSSLSLIMLNCHLLLEMNHHLSSSSFSSSRHHHPHCLKRSSSCLSKSVKKSLILVIIVSTCHHYRHSSFSLGRHRSSCLPVSQQVRRYHPAPQRFITVSFSLPFCLRNESSFIIVGVIIILLLIVPLILSSCLNESYIIHRHPSSYSCLHKSVFLSQ